MVTARMVQAAPARTGRTSAGAMKSQDFQVRRILVQRSGETSPAAVRAATMRGAAASAAAMPTVIQRETGWSKAWERPKRRVRGGMGNWQTGRAMEKKGIKASGIKASRRR